jgi:glycine/D-amino acid oxidase-like deaminating enzyme
MSSLLDLAPWGARPRGSSDDGGGECLGSMVDRRAGVLNADECVRAQLAMAARFGAELRFDERVTRWESTAAATWATGSRVPRTV